MEKINVDFSKLSKVRDSLKVDLLEKNLDKTALEDEDLDQIAAAGTSTLSRTRVQIKGTKDKT